MEADHGRAATVLMYPREGLSMGLEEGGGKAGSLASGLSFLQQVGAWQFSLNAWVSAHNADTHFCVFISFSMPLLGLFCLYSFDSLVVLCGLINGKGVLLFYLFQSDSSVLLRACLISGTVMDVPCEGL